MHEPVVVTDLNPRIIYWNAAASGIYGYSAAEALGRPIKELLDVRSDQQQTHSADVVSDLTTKTREFINGWNDRSHPFIWTKTADQILSKANRQKTSNSGHLEVLDSGIR